jgi:small subunit ribosomal protein S7e
MATAVHQQQQLKVVKRKGRTPSELEKEVAKAFSEIEKNASDIKSDLEALHFVAAKEISIPGGKKAIIVFVPLKLLQNYRKVQVRLVRELEKKFSGKNVVIIPQRKIIHKETKVDKVSKRKVPRKNTLTAVNDALLDDVCFPTEIVGKRLRIRLDNSRLLKIYLDKRDQPNVESRLDTFAHVYHKLTKRNVQFLFPPTQEIKNYSFKKKQQTGQQRSPKYGTALKKVTKAVKTGGFVSRAQKVEIRKDVARKAALRKVVLIRKAKQTRKAENTKKAAELKKLADEKRAARAAAKAEREAKASAAKASKAGKAAKSVKPAKGAKAAKPAKGAKPAQATQAPVKAAKAAKPSKPAQPAKTAKPAKK